MADHKVRVSKNAYELLQIASEKYGMSMTELVSKLIEAKLVEFLTVDLNKEPKGMKFIYFEVKDLKKEIDDIKLQFNQLAERHVMLERKIEELNQRVSKLELQCQRG